MPKFKVEYSSIHVTFLARIKDTDSFKDRKLWVKWNEGVWQAVADGFVIGHICDESLPGTPWMEWNTPLLRPIVSSNPTRKEIETCLKWDKNDGWTLSILTARLLDEVCNHLPPMINDRGERCTARQIYLHLKAAYQAAPNRKACLCIQDKLLNSQIHGMDIEKFNLKWSSTLTTLCNYGYDIPWDTLILKYILKLPSGPCYVYLKQVLEEEFDQVGVIPNRDLFDKFAICLENPRNRELLDLADSGGVTYNCCFQCNGNGGMPNKPPELQKPKDTTNFSKPNNKPSAYVAIVNSFTSNSTSKIEPVDTVNHVPNVTSNTDTTVCSTYPVRHLEPFVALLSSFPSSPVPISHLKNDKPITCSTIIEKTQMLLVGRVSIQRPNGASVSNQ
ncbi:hypothetical protein EV368DRAFT_84749 [Lentinula lateritia]|nr:hypothetical protein EV368DRAFT_84749 [Lentinula lateritia]